MKYKYNGSVATVLFLDDDLQTIIPGEVVDLSEAPSAEFSLLFKKTKAVSETKKQKKKIKSPEIQSEITNAIHTETIPIRK